LTRRYRLRNGAQPVSACQASSPPHTHTRLQLLARVAPSALPPTCRPSWSFVGFRRWGEVEASRCRTGAQPPADIGVSHLFSAAEHYAAVDGTRAVPPPPPLKLQLRALFSASPSASLHRQRDLFYRRSRSRSRQVQTTEFDVLLLRCARRFASATCARPGLCEPAASHPRGKRRSQCSNASCRTRRGGKGPQRNMRRDTYMSMYARTRTHDMRASAASQVGQALQPGGVQWYSQLVRLHRLLRSAKASPPRQNC
jgi:hypothetical protein